jgi:hypothetical protein
MNAGMAKVFREYIQKKQAEMQSEQQLNKNMSKEALKQKLMEWSGKVNKDKDQRGGEDLDTWNLTNKQEADDLERKNQDQFREHLKNQITYNADELFYRILRVEKTAENVKSFASAKEMNKIMSDINAINAQLGSRVPTAQSSGGRQTRQ